MLIPIYKSGKYFDIFARNTEYRGRGMVGPITWFNEPKPSPQSRTLCGIMCTLSIANSTLPN